MTGSDPGSAFPPHPAVKRSELPPGPPEHPVVGQLFRLLRDPIGLVHEAATYGDIATRSKKPVLLYLVNHPDLVQRLLVTQYRMLRRPPYLEALRMIVGNGLATAEEPTHLRSRRLIQPQFHRRRIEGYGRTMVEYALIHDERWKRLPSGSRVDISLEMQDLVRRVVTKTLFGLDLEEDARQLSEACERAASFIRRTNFHIRPLRRLVHRLPLPMTRRFRRDIAYIDGVVNGLIEARRAAREEGDDLLGMLLGLRYVDEDGKDAGAMNDRQVRDEAMTMFSAGQGTTTMGLAWTRYLLATHPEIQTRFHRELDEVLQRRPPEPADLQNLPLTNQIVTESLRLYPPVYMRLQLAAESFKLGGYKIREGALRTAPQIVVHRDARWFEDPQEFRPDRWTREFREFLHRYAYFPFGAGARQCIGDRFAEMALRLIIACLGQRWKMRSDPAHKVELLPRISLKAKGGLPLLLQQRNPHASSA